MALIEPWVNGLIRIEGRNKDAMFTKTILEVSNLRLQRGRTEILKNICWRVQRGEHWAVLGANGSGKTSLLSALTGYVTPTAGEILLLGQRYGRSDWRELRKQIGLVSSSVRRMMAPEEPALDTILSGKYAVIDFRGRPTAMERRRAERLLAQVKCAHLARQPWQVLSQGERQRVLIGRALMAQPRLLILDEPCAGLDPAAREYFLQFLHRLGRRRNSPTLVLVTHHVEEIMPVFSHALILRAREILAAGRKDSVLTSELLSEAFDAPMRLRKNAGRYALTLSARPGMIM